MKLEVTRASDLAVRALLALRPGRERLKGGDLAERLDATPAFMAQVMSPLVHRGWVDSAPGPTGGYRLDVDLAEVSVLDTDGIPILERVPMIDDGSGAVVVVISNLSPVTLRAWQDPRAAVTGVTKPLIPVCTRSCLPHRQARRRWLWRLLPCGSQRSRCLPVSNT